MEYLQYFGDDGSVALEHDLCFKPCYKWNTFNTAVESMSNTKPYVLNLVINGIPSILSSI